MSKTWSSFHPRFHKAISWCLFSKESKVIPIGFNNFHKDINRLGDDHVDIIDSKESTTEITIKEGQQGCQQVLQGADLLYDDSGQDSYLNPTFEASGSLS